MHEIGNVCLLIPQMIIYNWLIMTATLRRPKHQMKLWKALAALHSFHWLKFLFWCINRVKRMKAKGSKDYKAYTVEFVCCVLGLTVSDCTICCFSSYSKQAVRICPVASVRGWKKYFLYHTFLLK